MSRSIQPSNASVDEQLIRESLNDLLNGSNRAMRGDDLVSSNIFEYDPAGRLRIGKVIQNMQGEIDGTKVVINGITTGLQEISSKFEMTNQGLLAQTAEITKLNTHVELLRKRGDQIESRMQADSNASRELLSRVIANDQMIEVLARDQVKLSASLAIGEGSLSFMGNEVIANAEATQLLESRVTVTENSVTAMAQQITDLKASVNVLPRIFLQTNQPDPGTQGPFNVGDMWLKSDDGNKVFVWDGSTWSESVDLQGATVYAQTTPPTGAGLRVGDLWFDMSNNNRMHRWDGTQWVDITNPLIDATATATAQLRADVTLIQGQVTANSQSITNLNTQIAGKADQSAVNSLGTRVTAAEGLITSQGNAITTLQGQMAGKADASAVTALTTRMTAAEGLITSQGNAVTALQNSVQQIGGDNLLLNSSFEDRPSSDSTAIPNNWTISTNFPTAGRTWVPSSLPGSTNAQRVSGTSSAAGQYIDLRPLDTVAKVSPGMSYVLSVFCKNVYGYGTESLIMWFLDSAGNTIGSAQEDRFTHTENTWRRLVSTPRSAPANAAYVRCYLRHLSNGPTEVAGIEWDNAQLQQGLVATQWQPSNAEMVTNIAGQAAATTALTTRVTAAEGTISSLSSQVTDLNASIGAAGLQGTNMVLNGGFQSGRDVGWSYNSSTITHSATEGRNGGACLRIDGVPLTDRAAYANGLLPNNGRSIPAQSGRKYRFSCWYKTTANFNGTAGNSKLRLSTQTDALVGDRPFLPNMVDWTYVSGIYTVADVSTITGLRITLNMNHTAGTLWIDDVALEDVTDSEANAAATQSLTVRVTAAEGLITSQGTAITSLQSSLQQIGGDNFLPNSSFEESANATARPDNWNVETIGGISPVVSYVTSPLTGGGRAVRLDCTTTAANQWFGLNNFEVTGGANLPRIRPNVDYVLSSYVRGTAGCTAQIFVQFRNASNGITGTITLPAVTMDGTWQRLQLPARTANAASERARIYVGRITSPTAQAVFIEIDNAMFQEGQVATNWRPSGVEAATVNYANSTAIQSLTTRVTAAEGTITSQSTSITNLQSSLTTTSTDLANLIANGNNMVFDGGFEGRNVGQGVGVGFVTNEAARSGSKSLKITANGTIRDVIVGTIRNTGDSRVWYCECWVRNSPAGGVTTGNIQLAATAYNSSGAVIGYPQFKALASTSVTDTWQKLAGYVTPPAGTYTMGVRLSIRDNVPSGAVLWDDVFAVDVTDAYNARAVADATATAVTTLDTKVTGIDGRVTAQATQITALTASIAGKADASVVVTLEAKVNDTMNGGGNLIVNSTFASDISGWQWRWNPGNWTAGRDVAGPDWAPYGGHNVGMSRGGVVGQAQYGVLYTTPYIPCTAGKRYMFSAKLSGHRSRRTISILFIDNNGNNLGEPQAPWVDSGTVGNNGGKGLSNWTPVQVSGVAPAGTVAMAVGLWGDGRGENDPYVWMTQPMLEEVPADKTTPSPWSAAGNDAYASWQVMTDVNGYIAGLQLKNTGGTSNFRVRSDVFEVVPPGGGARTEFSNGNWRVYDAAGTLRVAMGINI